jgi:hypothetical protein
VQNCEIPKDLDRYYGTNYYSVVRSSKFVRVAKEARLKYLTTGRGLLGRSVTMGKSNPEFEARAAQLNRENRGDQFLSYLRKA